MTEGMDAEERADLDLYVMVEVKIYKGGHLCITSPDVPGLTLAGEDYLSIFADLIPVITTLQAMNGSPRIRSST